MTRGDKGKLFIRFLPIFTLSLFRKIVCSLCTDEILLERSTSEAAILKLAWQPGHLRDVIRPHSKARRKTCN